MFSSVASFSAAMQIANSPAWGGIDMDAARTNADAINELDTLWVGCGTEDGRTGCNGAADFGRLPRSDRALDVPRVARDPDDDHVLACALAATAELIVSGDLALLALTAYERIPIVTPARRHAGRRTAPHSDADVADFFLSRPLLLGPIWTKKQARGYPASLQERQ
jgi:hypothetical protein